MPPPLSDDDKERIDTWLDHDSRLTEIAHELHTNVLELAEWSRQPHIRRAFRLIRQIADERTRTLHAEAAHQALQRLNSISTHSPNEETARRAAKNILSWNPERRTFARGLLPHDPTRPPRRRTRRRRFNSLAPPSSPASSPTVPRPGSPSRVTSIPSPTVPTPRIPTLPKPLPAAGVGVGDPRHPITQNRPPHPHTTPPLSTQPILDREVEVASPAIPPSHAPTAQSIHSPIPPTQPRPPPPPASG